MNQKVSILIPAYNAERWIADTIQSALSQTWKNTEVIIVDDGSTDGTLPLIRQYESERCRIIQQENKGGCSARNHALHVCQGDYIQWLDADDLLAPDKVEQQMDAAVKLADPWVVFSSAWGRFSYRPARASFQPTPLWRSLDSVTWLVLRMCNPWMMHPAAWLVSRSLTDRAGPWDERLLRNQDGEYFCRVLSLSHSVKFVPEARSYYRIANANSVSNSRSDEALDSFSFSLEQEVRHLLAREDSQRTRKACVHRLNVGIAILEGNSPANVERLKRRIQDLGGQVEAVQKSKKFTLVSNLIGREKAKVLKISIWHIRRTVSIIFDFWLSKLRRSDLR